MEWAEVPGMESSQAGMSMPEELAILRAAGFFSFHSCITSKLQPGRVQVTSSVLLLLPGSVDLNVT